VPFAKYQGKKPFSKSSIVKDLNFEFNLARSTKVSFARFRDFEAILRKRVLSLHDTRKKIEQI
jgi:hypothetical protein